MGRAVTACPSTAPPAPESAVRLRHVANNEHLRPCTVDGCPFRTLHGGPCSVCRRFRRGTPKARAPSPSALLKDAALEVDAEPLPTRPTTRGDCADVPRPCPFVSCRHHLYLDVSARTGAIRIAFSGEPDEMPANASCSLDVAEEDGVTLERAGEMMGVVRERIRQLEAAGLAKLGPLARRLGLDVGREGSASKRRLPIVVDEDEGDEEGGHAEAEGCG